MLIFTLPSWYKSADFPENCIFIYEQMQQLKKCGHTVIVLSVQSIPIQRMKKANKNIVKIDDNGIITYYTEIISIWPSTFKRLYTRFFRQALNRLIDKAIEEYGNPDVYYAHFSFPAGYVSTNLKNRVPLVSAKPLRFPAKENAWQGNPAQRISKSLGILFFVLSLVISPKGTSP
mgnify:CR=1 FL=1